MSEEQKNKLLDMAERYRANARLDRGKALKWGERADQWEQDAETLERMAKGGR